MIAKFQLICILVLVLTFSGCNTAIEHVAFHSANKGKKTPPIDLFATPAKWWHGVVREDFIEVKNPDAIIHTWMIDPTFSDLKQNQPTPKPKGTILLIHGFRCEMARLTDIARRYANHGYRCILVDLRGHGRSTGDYMTYGVHESHDMVQIIDYFQNKNLIAGQLGVWGISMGASTAIQHAAQDPRVKTVIAVAPYTRLRDVMPRLVRYTLPTSYLTHSDQKLQTIINDGSQTANFNPDDADTITALNKTNIPILFIHGKCDFITPVNHSRTLHNAAKDRTKLVEIDLMGHLAAHWPLLWSWKAKDIAWFDEKLTR